MSGGLRSATHWWPSARLWRFVLTAQPDGSWDPHGGVAAALLASTATASRPKLHGVQLVVSFVQSVATLAAQVFLPGGGGGSAASVEAILEGRRTTPLVEVHYLSADKERSGVEALPTDCPLVFSGDAILASMPAELQAAKLKPEVAARVWTTALVEALLPELPASWREGPHESEGSTLADRAGLWLDETLAGELEGLRATLRTAAVDQLTFWAVVHDRQLTTARFHHISTMEHAALLAERSVASVIHAALTQHSTLSIFTSEALVGSRRWCVAPRTDNVVHSS